jgi:hypothetical protein
MSIDIHDVSNVEEQFLAMDVRGQIVRNRKDVLGELLESLRADYAGGRFRSVVIHYRIFLHHAVNALLVATIRDSRVLAGQDTPSGTDTEKVQQALDGSGMSTLEIRKLCNGLSESLHAIHPPPEDSPGLAKVLMEAAGLWMSFIDKEDQRLNKWWDDSHKNGVTVGRFQPTVQRNKRTLGSK